MFDLLALLLSTALIILSRNITGLVRHDEALVNPPWVFPITFVCFKSPENCSWRICFITFQTWNEAQCFIVPWILLLTFAKYKWDICLPSFSKELPQFLWPFMMIMSNVTLTLASFISSFECRCAGLFNSYRLGSHRLSQTQYSLIASNCSPFCVLLLTVKAWDLVRKDWGKKGREVTFSFCCWYNGCFVLKSVHVFFPTVTLLFFVIFCER